MSTTEIKAIVKKHALGQPLTDAEKETLRKFKEAKKAKPAEPAREEICDLGTLENLFGITSVWIQKLAKEGTIVSAGHGKYELWPSVRGYIQHLKSKRKNQWDGDQDSDDGQSYEAHRARLTAAKADMAEIEAKLRKEQVHDAGAVATVWADMIGNAKNKLLALPTAIAGQVHGEESLETIRATIEEAVLQALNELAEYDPTLATNRYIQSNSSALETASEVEDLGVGGQPEETQQRGKRRTRAVEDKPSGIPARNHGRAARTRRKAHGGDEQRSDRKN